MCTEGSYVLHASRQNTGTEVWVDSGALLGPDLDAHDARVALDSGGGAILLALSSSGLYTSATQGNSGGAWSAFKTAVSPQGSTIISDLASDDTGQVTLVYESITYPTSQALAVNGSITSNTWSSPVVLSGTDTSVGQVYFAQVSNGASLAIWLSSSGTPAIRAATRATATGAWSTPVNLSGPGSYISYRKPPQWNPREMRSSSIPATTPQAYIRSTQQTINRNRLARIPRSFRILVW